MLSVAAVVLELALVLPGNCFQRGDFDQNDRFDISDPIGTLQWLFTVGARPACLDAADANDDGSINIADAIASLGYLFSGREPPPAPYPDCGLDTTTDRLSCDQGSSCPGSGCDRAGLAVLLLVGGEPIAGVEVHVTSMDAGGEALEATTAITGPGGIALAVPHARAAEVALLALLPGYQPAWASVLPGVHEVTLELLPASVVAGTILDDGGAPLGGARVLALPLRDFAGHETVSAADGTFLLSHLSRRPEALAILHVGYAMAVAQPVTESLRVQLDRGLTLHGPVLDARDNTPIQARLRIERADLPAELTALDARSTDAAGVYELEHLSSGTHFLRAESPGYLPATFTVEVHRDQQPFPTRLHLASGTPLVVTVLDIDRQPIAGVIVTAFEPVTQHFVAATSDEEGIATLSPVPDLPLLIHATKAGYERSAPVTALPTERPTIHLLPETRPGDGVSLALRLLGPAGEHVVSHWAVIASSSDTWRIGSQDRPVTGNVLQQLLPPGDYEILVGSGELAGGLQITLARESPAPSALRLEQGLRVRLRTTGGERIQRASAGLASGAFDFATRDEEQDRSLTLSPLPARQEVALAIELDNGRTAYWVVQEDRPGATIDIELPSDAIGSLRGELVWNGAPVSGVSLKLSDAASHENTFLAVTDEDGAFAFTGVPTGFYTLRQGVTEGGERFWWPLRDEVLVAAGKERRMVLDSLAAIEPAADQGGGGGAKPTCECYWKDKKTQESTKSCRFDRNDSTDGGKKVEQEFNCQRGAKIDSAWTHALIHYPWRLALFGWRYVSASALEAHVWRTEAGYEITEPCYFCEPEIKGQLTVDIVLDTDGGNLSGAFASITSTAAATLNVSGDLKAAFAPAQGAATACGLGGPGANVEVGGVQIPMPIADCDRDQQQFQGSAGPTAVQKKDFCIILNSSAHVRSRVRGLMGFASAEAKTLAEFKIVTAVCRGKCNHKGDGCPVERDVIILRD